MSPEAMTRDVPLPVQLAVTGPAEQRRWTVLIRGIMLIPHHFVLYFLSIAFAVVAFIGWWGALFTGRLPEFAANYLSGFTRWSTRVQAYALLLTDQYPPFSLDDEPGYPVRIAIPPRDRLNRAAVLFRVILVIPASLLNGLVTFGGTTIVGFIAWLIALITGKLPTSLHLAYTAILRYTTRLNCYFYMLTAAYPGGLFGDGPAVPYGAAVPPAGDFDPAAPGYETPGELAAWQPADWRLLLTRGARQLLGWFIGIGAVLWVAWIVVAAVIGSSSGNVAVTSNAIDTVNAADNTLSSKLNNYQNTVLACTSAGCVETADAQAATAFTNFASTLHGTPMPGSAAAAANKVSSDATKVAQDLTQLGHLSPTVSATQYASTANSIGIAQATTQFRQDFTALDDALNNSR